MTEFITKYLIEAGYEDFSVGQNGNSFTSSLDIDLTPYIEKGLLDELRNIRDERLAESDWRAGQDTPTMSQAWVDYRQALRDITDGAAPQIDDDGSLTNVTMPTRPV